MRKKIAVLLSALFAALLLSACGVSHAEKSPFSGSHYSISISHNDRSHAYLIFEKVVAREGKSAWIHIQRNVSVVVDDSLEDGAALLSAVPLDIERFFYPFGMVRLKSATVYVSSPGEKAAWEQELEKARKKYEQARRLLEDPPPRPVSPPKS